ncbi:MAG: heme-binding domain-containing protein, partial [Akkermansiaceae bacterium]|nr:heme-binding domain-containing protein [Akkermansiaceae bacterium]
HEKAFALFAKHGLTPQVWKTLKSPAEGGRGEKVGLAVEAMMPLAERTRAMGCKLGLYNHGGWGGEPENLVAACKVLHSHGHDHVGIVYNFHHGHGHIDDFAESFALMKPYLLCVNLNGMADPETVKGKTNKILPIGAGKHEARMIEAILASGYDGPIGILGHRFDEDVKFSLQNNLHGLEEILNTLIK